MNTMLTESLRHDYPEILESCLELGAATCVIFNPQGNLLAIGFADGHIIIWDCNSRSQLFQISEMPTALLSLSFSRDSRYLAGCSIDGQLHRYDLIIRDTETKKLDRALSLPYTPKSIQLHPQDSNFCLVSCGSKPVFLVDFDDCLLPSDVSGASETDKERNVNPRYPFWPQSRKLFLPPIYSVPSQTQSNDESTNSSNQSFSTTIDMRNNVSIVPKLPSYRFSTLTTVDGQSLLNTLDEAVENAMGLLQQTGFAKSNDRVTSEYVTAAAFDPSGALLLLATSKGSLQLVDAISYEPLVLISSFQDAPSQGIDTGVPWLPYPPQPSSSIKSLSFSRDGLRCAALSHDKTIRVYTIPLVILLCTQAFQRKLIPLPLAPKFPNISGPLSMSVQNAVLCELQLMQREYDWVDCLDTVSKSPWRAIGFSPSGNYVYGLVNDKGDHLVFTWSVYELANSPLPPRFASLLATVSSHTSFSQEATPQLLEDLKSWRKASEKDGLEQTTLCTLGSATIGATVCRLQGPKEGAFDLASSTGTACVPSSSAVASVTAGGRVLIWTAHPKEKWSAFAPDFEELIDNVDYVEREDEFDLVETMITSGFDRKRDIVYPWHERNESNAQYMKSQVIKAKNAKNVKNVKESGKMDPTQDSGIDIMSPWIPKESMDLIKVSSQYKLLPEIDPLVVMMYSKACEALELQTLPPTIIQTAPPTVRPNTELDIIHPYTTMNRFDSSEPIKKQRIN